MAADSVERALLEYAAPKVFCYKTALCCMKLFVRVLHVGFLPLNLHVVGQAQHVQRTGIDFSDRLD